MPFAYSKIQTVVFTTTSVTLAVQLLLVWTVPPERNLKNRRMAAHATILESPIAMSKLRQLSEVFVINLTKKAFFV